MQLLNGSNFLVWGKLWMILDGGYQDLCDTMEILWTLITCGMLPNAGKWNLEATKRAKTLQVRANVVYMHTWGEECCEIQIGRRLLPLGIIVPTTFFCLGGFMEGLLWGFGPLSKCEAVQGEMALSLQRRGCWLDHLSIARVIVSGCESFCFESFLLA